MENTFAYLGAMIALGGILAIALYVYTALAIQTMAKKTLTPNPWLAWIPIANLYLLTQIGGLPGWTVALILVNFVPIIGTLAFMGITVWWWWKAAEALHKPGWISLLMLIPIVNLVIIGVLAWSD